jgi:hypothetical protein
MRFTRAGGGSLVLSDEVVATLGRYRQHGRSDPEAGGILLGRILASGEVVLVDRVTEPTSADRRSRTRFIRAREPTQSLIQRHGVPPGGPRSTWASGTLIPRTCRTRRLRICATGSA